MFSTCFTADDNSANTWVFEKECNAIGPYRTGGESMIMRHIPGCLKDITVKYYLKDCMFYQCQ